MLCLTPPSNTSALLNNALTLVYVAVASLPSALPCLSIACHCPTLPLHRMSLPFPASPLLLTATLCLAIVKRRSALPRRSHAMHWLTALHHCMKRRYPAIAKHDGTIPSLYFFRPLFKRWDGHGSHAMAAPFCFPWRAQLRHTSA